MCASKENQHWCINYMTLLPTGIPCPWSVTGEVRLQSKYIWILSTSDSIKYIKSIRVYLISTTKETDLRLLFCFHLKLCLTGNVYKVCCSKVSKYPPLAKLCHVWIQNLFLTQIKKKWLNMENKLALSILGDLDQIDWFVE